MSIPTQTINVTDLDFDQIKSNLINYFKTSDTQFKDWDYTGSNLNVLIDVLSHNTHYNAVLAHLAINESFIDSAQIRSNVVSAAKLIGYTPRSHVSAIGNVSLEIQLFDNSIEKYVIPRGSIFTGNVTNNQTGKFYDFTCLEDIICTKDVNTGYYAAQNVELRQGYIETKRVQINTLRDKNEYIIDETNIDIDTLKVAVYPDGVQNVAEIYNKFSKVTGINEESLIYFIYENYDGKYVISFGNGVFGKKPNNLNILELSYIVTDGLNGNKITKYEYSDFLDTTKISSFSVNALTTSYNGSDREDMDSIKYNAPLQYISQDRAVTADDYSTLIKAKYPLVESISVWGGEDNDPPQYGKVFICIKKRSNSDDDFLSLDVKRDILSFLKGKKILAIMPEIVDPEYIDIVLDVLFKYNSNMTTLATTQMENLVKDQVIAFNTKKLKSFDGVFRHSLLSRTIDTTSPAILNSLIRVYVSKKITFDSTLPKEMFIKYGTTLQPDDGKVIINSSPFRKNGVLHYFGDVQNADNPNLRDVYMYYYNATTKENVIVDNNIGTINLQDGTLRLSPITVDNIGDGTQTISLDLIPVSNDIVAQRNQLIRIDTNRLSIYGEVDIIEIGGTDKTNSYRTFTRDRA